MLSKMTRPDSNPKQIMCLNTALLQESSGGSIRNRLPRCDIPPSSTEILCLYNSFAIIPVFSEILFSAFTCSDVGIAFVMAAAFIQRP